MKKQRNAPEQVSVEQISQWDDHDFVSTFSKYALYLVLGIGTLIVSMLVIYQLWNAGQSRADRDYADAEKEFRIFIGIDGEKTSAEGLQKAFTQLQILMKQHPELEAKYDGMIAQTLINRNQDDLAAPFAQRALKRTQQENSPYYASYAETTLLIGNNNYNDALAQAKQLQQRIQEAPHPDAAHIGDMLVAFNLLRIGMLQHQLGLKEEESKSWTELQQFLKKNPEIAAQINLQAGQISLLDYIKAQGNLSL